MGSVFNLAGNYFEYNTSETDFKADRKALISDWGVIGLDIKNSIAKLDSKTGPKQLEIEFNE